ncbi:MAG: ABC transporter substrate-binding protein [Syntrophomonadaceae bacterium]|nr:ABC transporter substrate-binding protein [Syntrophomonadaceae bacterium]
MKRTVSVALILMLMFGVMLSAAGCANNAQTPAPAPETAPRTMTDSAGRTVTLPAKVNKVYCTTPAAATMLYILAPETLLGWNYQLAPHAKNFIPAPYNELPNLGAWHMTKTTNVEELLKYDFELVLLSVPTDPAIADDIATQTGKPVFVINYPVTESGQYFEVLGEILGKEQRANELADYCNEVIKEIGDKAATIPQDELVTVYYAEGNNGLMTDPKGSIISQALDYVNGQNVADIPEKGGGGMTPITLEQLLKWDPEVIVTWSTFNEKPGFLVEQILANGDWKEIQAVKNKRVYEAPADKPFSFFGRLPAANQIIGFKWAGQLLYPDVYQYDIRQEIKEFYKLFYQLDLTDSQLDDVLDYGDERHLQ